MPNCTPLLRRTLRLSMAAALCALLTGCQGIQMGTAQLRVIDASADAGALDTYGNSQGLAYSLGYGSLTSYMPTTPGQQIQEALRAASQGGFTGGGAQSGDDGMNAPVQHQGIQGSVNILSNTMGVDFAHYLQQVIAATKRAWYPIIPEEARPPLNKQGIVQIRFTINANGNVTGMQLYGPSGDVALDRAAWGGITGATPYPPLPKQFLQRGGKHLSLQFNFLYNETPGDAGN